MLTKRQAVAAIYMGCLAKMAHADQPASPHYTASIWNQPTTWNVNLDQMKDLRVTMGDKSVTITAAEIFDALQRTP